MTDIASKIVASGRLLPAIHGLRGAAALAVVIFHAVAILKISLPDFLSFAGKYFGYSVHLFFVLSAFSLMYSTLPTIRSDVWVQNYFIKRFFRIAPLFYFMIFIMIGCAFIRRSPLPNISEIFVNLTFVYGMVPPYTGGLVWGSWAIGVEVLFYVIFPVLLVLVQNLRASVVLIIFSTIASFGVRSLLHQQYLASVPVPRWDPSYFSFGSNCLFFAFGIWAFHLRNRLESFRGLLVFARVSALLILAGMLFTNLASSAQSFARFDLLAWGLVFALLCVVESLKPSFLMANCVMEYFGERSFSMYLVHPFIFVILKPEFEALRSKALPLLGPTITSIFELIAALVIIMPFAEATYRFIELPGIKLGKAIIKSNPVGS